MHQLAAVARAVRRPVSPKVFRWLTVAAVLLLALIVVTGAAVRLTGSGLGCPTWPRCGDGSFVTRSQFRIHGVIEFGNRIVSSTVSIVVFLVAIAAFRLRERRDDFRWLSIGLVGGIVGQIVLGGFTVLYHLNPGLVAGHFLLSMALLFDAVILQHRVRIWAASGEVRLAGRPSAVTPGRPAAPLRWLGWLLTVAAAVVLAVGTVVTGSGPHSGDGTHVARFSLDIREVAQLHADVAMLLVGLVVATAAVVYATKVGASARREAAILCVLVLAQAGIGFLQYALGIPEGLVAVHVAGATALWIYTLRLALVLSADPLTGSALAGTVPHPAMARSSDAPLLAGQVLATGGAGSASAQPATADR